ncbi:tripartite tricarboxylate transporter substrate-binding protein [Alterinioella nitratireducens]|jgi:tripartite-type tricarboxylate transporter receptor subunit TctC|uniref:tripartite tricarboxylate transporter substrate-binding protein n=1 Tax=Alterinioella nitratireducens TaxID=2735915 RepID=UPI000C93A0A5|nr:transporter [Dinoroseobacter sp.]
MMIKQIAAAALALGVSATGALAEYPDRPVSIVVPFPPGDLEDVLTRMVAEDFQEAYGVPTAVINVPGGGGGPFPGAVQVANAPADGSVIGSFVVAVPVVGPNLGIPELSPNPFEPLGIFLTYPFVIAASGDAPYSTMQELADYAQDNDLVLGHFGAPLVPTRVTLALADRMGFSYGSDAAFDALDCNTLASGDADVINTTLQLILPCLDDVTILASVTGERISILDDVPTVAEIEPSLNLSLWNGLFVHRDTPQEVRDAIIAVARETMASERAQTLAEETGALIYWQNAEEATAQIEADTDVINGL